MAFRAYDLDGERAVIYRSRMNPSLGRNFEAMDTPRCGKRMSVIAFVTDSAAIGRILDHPGLSNPEAEKPPPPLRERLRVAEHGDGWGVVQEWD